jgi:adenosylcobyric acid synthase
MKTSAMTLMVQGTASSVGKSLIATALCRYFRREGLRVAPFKSQNMALNSAVTPDGLEIGRAQAIQAVAAGVPARVEMNPILLKPEGDRRSQVVVRGKPIGSFSAVDYHAHKPQLRGVIAESLEQLRSEAGIVIIEGAGSPAEVNLRDRDLVNMFVARTARAPVLLVGDIDRGGVFAAFVGTMELLEPEDRPRVGAFVVNKFRGDLSLLQPGLDFLTGRTGVPVLGVVPHLRALRIAEEDSVSLDHRRRRAPAGPEAIDVAVVRLPRISNYDDLEPLEHQPGVVVRFVEHPHELRGADLVILPGSKCTATDLHWLRERGLADEVLGRARRSEPVLGICGGCQMLGERIDDPLGVESPFPEVPGLGLLPLRTRFEREKTTAQVRARVLVESFLAPAGAAELEAYEIHMGQLERTAPGPSAFELTRRHGQPVALLDGAAQGSVVGTLLHGILENRAVREHLLATLRRRKGLPPASEHVLPTLNEEIDRLERAFRESIDRALLWRLAESSLRAREGAA